jgi:RAB protein geranylgeranyltransferase component A
LPLHGGGGELSQAFCRSAAVKGATYILGRSIKKIAEHDPIVVEFDTENDDLRIVKCRHVVRLGYPAVEDSVEITRSIVVVEGLEGLFGDISGHPDAALIVIPPKTVREEQTMPIQIIIHGGGIGECPVGQCMSICDGTKSRDNV